MHDHLPLAVARLLQRPETERRLGPFILVKQLGRGGFAPVWLAREVYGETELRAAAVKLFSLEGLTETDLRGATRSARRDPIVAEARALCSVEHPNVVRFYALSIDETEGVMGLAMEHVAGTPLDVRIASAGLLPAAEVLRVGVAIASALSAVHRAGLVHRDVKPSNIIEAAGVYKLIDFGIAAAPASQQEGTAPRADPTPAAPAERRSAAPARTPRAASPDPHRVEAVTLVVAAPPPPNEGGAGPAPATVRLAGAQSGTIGYMDPSCFARGAPASPASDLYALGATLFECLTGRVPAAASQPHGKLDPRVLSGAAPPPRLVEAAPEVPPALASLVERMIASDQRDRPPSAEWVAIRLEQIRRELAGAVERELPSEEVGPFRGLGRFEERDRDIYFGRISEIAASIEVLRGRGLLALVGSSGSGKSSLARAGVLPALADGALGGWPERWDTAVAEPGSDPRAAVAAALAGVVPDAAARSPEGVVAALIEHAQSTGRGVALLLDQLEELATLAEGEGRDWTAALLCRLADHALPGVRAVVAARRDLLDPLLAVGQLGRALARGLVLIEPITDLGWSDVLDEALASYGYTLEDDALRQELLLELKATADAMPLVQFALAELWEKRDAEQKKITRAGLRAIGGIAGALERHAEATLAALEQERPEATEAARTVLLALTTPEGTRAARDAAELSVAAGPAGAAAIEAFKRGRLVVPCEGGITLAHEALLSQWGRLRAWVAEAREHRLLAEELERDAGRWRADPDAVPLWQRRRIAYAEELRSRGTLLASPDALSFLRASRRAARRVRMVMAGGAVVVALSLLGAGIGYVRAVQANEAAARVEETAARKALEKEQEARRNAEAQRLSLEETNNKLREANERIDGLIEQLASANTEEERQELETKIRKEQNEVRVRPTPTFAGVSSPPHPTPAKTAPEAPASAVPAVQPATTF